MNRKIVILDNSPSFNRRLFWENLLIWDDSRLSQSLLHWAFIRLWLWSNWTNLFSLSSMNHGIVVSNRTALHGRMNAQRTSQNLRLARRFRLSVHIWTDVPLMSIYTMTLHLSTLEFSPSNESNVKRETWNVKRETWNDSSVSWCASTAIKEFDLFNP
jgi:hypothetical protein